jgi:hypothetical protein
MCLHGGRGARDESRHRLPHFGAQLVSALPCSDCREPERDAACPNQRRNEAPPIDVDPCLFFGWQPRSDGISPGRRYVDGSRRVGDNRREHRAFRHDHATFADSDERIGVIVEQQYGRGVDVERFGERAFQPRRRISRRRRVSKEAGEMQQGLTDVGGRVLRPSRQPRTRPPSCGKRG